MATTRPSLRISSFPLESDSKPAKESSSTKKRTSGRVHAYRLNRDFIEARLRHNWNSRYVIRRLFEVKADREQNLLLRMLKRIPFRVANRPLATSKIIKLVMLVFVNIGIGYVMTALSYKEIERELGRI